MMTMQSKNLVFGPYNEREGWSTQRYQDEDTLSIYLDDEDESLGRVTAEVSEEVVSLIVRFYRLGVRRGKESGRFEAKHEMRRALGV